MKQIFNYKKATVLDIESDGLLDEATKIYIVGFQMHNHKDVKVFWGDTQEDRIKALFQWHIDNQIPVVAHNGITYDIPLIEKLYGMDLSNLMVIDTLGLSWYLNIHHNKHSIEVLAEDYDVGSKFEVDSGDWVKLTKEQAINRVTSDVVINKAMYDDFVCRLEDMYSLSKEMIDKGLVGGKRVSPDEKIYIDSLKGLSVEEHVNRILTFLMFKKDCQRLQEKTKWHVDVPYLQENIARLEEMVEKSAKELEAIMPPVPVYTVRKEPKNRFKKNGEPSVAGQKWLDVLEGLKKGGVDEWGNPLFKVDKPGEVKELTSYNPPNINGHQQVKDFLTSHGWEPETFKIIKDKEANNAWFASKPREGAPKSEWDKWKASKPEDRAVPQVRVDGKEGKELCESVIKLADKVPEIRVLEEYSVMKHRLDTMKGILSRVKDGKVEATCHGWTNTLRLQHSAPCVNLPSAKRKYAEAIRGCLIAPEGYISIGSDLSSLEDRCKVMLMIPHDPDYAAEMSKDDFDPHLTTAVAMGEITEQDMRGYIEGSLSPEDKARVGSKRRDAKPVNYMCLPKDNTEVLTEGGWKWFDQLSKKDRVLSFNPVTGLTEFTEILGIVEFSDAEIVEMSNHHWRLESTAEHRWLVTERSHNRREPDRMLYRTTTGMTTESKIVSSAKYSGGLSGVKPQEAALVAWILSDGYLKVSPLTGISSQGVGGYRRGVVASVAQSEKKFLGELRKTISECGVDYTEDVREDRVHIFRFKSKSFRDFWSGVGLPLEDKDSIDYTQWLLGLSYESLEAFLEAFYLADGHTAGNIKYKTKVIHQNRGKIADAVQLCSELLGRNTYVRGYGDRQVTIRSQESCTLGMQKTKRVINRKTDVFCLTTRNSNFVIRQNGFITITGNCVYGGTYKALMIQTGWPEQRCKDAIDAYWEKNWSVKAIAEEQVIVQDSRENNWLINPINGFLYNVRSEKDYFSTLCQGTGAFFFDMWVDGILRRQEQAWGVKSLTAQYHDEVIFVIKDKGLFKEKLYDMIKESINEVNKTFILRRELDCDVQHGKRYSEIH